MRIGVISDTHLGHKRFAKDAMQQMVAGFEKLHDVDLIVHAGDMFDVPSPSFNTLKEAYDVFKRVEVPLLAISGNHDRRPKDVIDPTQFLASMGAFEYIHRKVFLKGGLAVMGMSYIHESHARDALEHLLEENRSQLEGAEKKVLVIHQNIKDYSPGEGLDRSWLLSLGFDLVIDGHIHKRIYDGRILLPGSSVVTKINEDEVKPRGVTIVDLDFDTPRFEFVEIPQRSFSITLLEFSEAKGEDVISEVMEAYESFIKENPGGILKVKLRGSIVTPLPILPSREGLYVDNQLVNVEMEKKLKSWRESFSEVKEEVLATDEEVAVELAKKVEGTEELIEMLYHFSPEEIVERLME